MIVYGVWSQEDESDYLVSLHATLALAEAALDRLNGPYRRAVQGHIDSGRLPGAVIPQNWPNDIIEHEVEES